MTKEKICGIYCIENTLNNKKYIGQSRNVHKRWEEHRNQLNKDKHGNTHLQSAWNKYGENAFDFYIIETCEIDMLDCREKYHIAHYDSSNRIHGYNIDLGGFYTKELSDETKNKLSIWAKQRVGDKNPFYGKHHTEDTKKHLGETNSRIWKNKFGVKHNKSIGVFCVETNSFYGSSREAEYYTGIDHTSISRCCRQLQNTAGGYHWIYNDEYIQSNAYEIDKIVEKTSDKTLKVVCLNNNQIFESSKEASLWCNLKQPSSIRNCCLGISKTSGSHPITSEKLKWCYLKDYVS